MIEKAVEERGLDHFVIASCSPRFQGPTFERIARELRLGENAVAFGNIREGCSFIHKDEPERAQQKARKIVEGAVARGAAPERPAAAAHLPHRSVLVVGGGIAGIRPPRSWPARHRGASGRTPAEHRRLHGPPQQDLPYRGLRDVLARAAPHERRT